MCDPSLADASAASWTASLAASRANLTVSPASALVETIRETFGARPGASSSSLAPGSSSSKTLEECSRPRAGQNESAETFSAWVVRLREASSARRKLARRTSANGFSSSAWPTVTANMVTGAGSEGRDGGLNLQTAAACWSTPTARDHRSIYASGETHGRNARPLSEMVGMWSTPRASDGEKSGPGQTFTDGGGMPLMAQIGRWPTPDASLMNDGEGVGTFQERRERLRRKKKNGNGMGMPLTVAATCWSTPRVSTGGYTRDRGKAGAERLTLDGEARWSTPSVADVMGGRVSRSGARKSERLLNGQAPDLCSRLVQATGTHGNGSPETRLNAFRRYRATTDSALRSERRALLLMAIRRRDQAKPGEVRRLQRGWTRTGLTGFVRPSFRRSLNPRFVGDLMGWPPGLTSFACSETAWSNWRARMRSELSRMSLHRAPPEQLTLFG